MTAVKAEMNYDLARMTYDEMLEMPEQEEVLGAALTEKEDLLSVPFIITRLTFRTSDKSEAEYVSVEATTVKNEHVVFNDGSTGIRRQLVLWAMDKAILARTAIAYLSGSA